MSIEAVDGPTFTPTINYLIELAESRKNETNRAGNPHGNAGAEFTIAQRALEEAQMRYTRGLAMMLGVFKPADLESDEAIAERRAFLDRVEEARGA